MFIAKSWRSVYFRSWDGCSTTPCIQCCFSRCFSNCSKKTNFQWGLDIHRRATNASHWQLVSRKAFYFAVTFSAPALRGSPQLSHYSWIGRQQCYLCRRAPWLLVMISPEISWWRKALPRGSCGGQQNKNLARATLLFCPPIYHDLDHFYHIVFLLFYFTV